MNLPAWCPHCGLYILVGRGDVSVYRTLDGWRAQYRCGLCQHLLDGAVTERAAGKVAQLYAEALPVADRPPSAERLTVEFVDRAVEWLSSHDDVVEAAHG